MPGKQIKQIQLYIPALLITVGYIALNVIFTIKVSNLFNVLPFVLIVSLLILYRLDIAFLFTIFILPLSVPLYHFNEAVSNNLSLPAEPIIIIICAVFILKLLYERKFDKRILYHPVSIFFYINLFWILITSITSSMPEVSFKFLASRIWILVVFYFLASQVFRDKVNIDKFFWLYIISFILVIGYTLLRHLPEGLNNKDAAHWVMKPFFPDHTSYGAALALFLPIILLYLFRKPGQHFFLKVLTTIVGIIFTVAFILSYTRAAWLSLLLALLVYVVLYFKIKPRIIILILGVSIAVFFSVRVQVIQNLERNKQNSSDNLAEHVQSIANITSDESNLERLNRWSSAFTMFAERPLFGWGPGTYMFQYAPYQQVSMKTSISTNAGDKGNAHSEYFGPLSESGLPGMLSVLAMFLAIIYTGIKVYKRSTDKNVRSLSLAVVIGLITYFLHGALNNFLDMPKLAAPVFTFAAILVVLDVYDLKEGVKTDLPSTDDAI